LAGKEPLADGAKLLTDRYQKPVTWEGQVIRWSGDLVDWRLPNGNLGRGPDGLPVKDKAPRKIVVPAGLMPEATPDLGAAVRALVDAYQAQNPDGPRYRVLESNFGFHIVVSQSRDESGNLVAVQSPLDYRITVPLADRTATGHLNALCDAVTAALAATGVAGLRNRTTDFGSAFATGGYDRSQPITGQERPGTFFRWGATGLIARDALIDLLSHAATTLTWRLECGQPQQGCSLGTYHMYVGPQGRQVNFDRCPSCGPAQRN
jgi:hypothetical protein